MESQKYCQSNKLALSSLIISLGIIASSLIASRALVEIKSANQTITVKGYADKTIDSDMVVWRSSFAINSKDLVSGYTAIENDLKKVLTYLINSGISRDSIQVSAVTTNSLFVMTSNGNVTNQIEGYRLAQSIVVKSSNIQLIDKISKESSVLIKDNISWESGIPEYYYSKVDDLKVAMLGDAAKDAKRRAEQLAESSGNKVGSLRNAQQGVFQITPEYSASVSDYGEYDTSSIRKTIKAVVTMQYSIR